MNEIKTNQVPLNSLESHINDILKNYTQDHGTSTVMANNLHHFMDQMKSKLEKQLEANGALNADKCREDFES